MAQRAKLLYSYVKRAQDSYAQNVATIIILVHSNNYKLLVSPWPIPGLSFHLSLYYIMTFKFTSITRQLLIATWDVVKGNFKH